MVFTALTVAVLANAQEMAPGREQLAMAHVPGNPIMNLPGMKPNYLIETLPPTNALPAPLISDVINVPNPFDSRKPGLAGQTQISYHLENAAHVIVTMYDLLGFRVRRWDFQPDQNGGQAGLNSFLWDGTNESNQKVSKGGYLAQIEISLPGTVLTVIRKIGVIH